MADPDGFQNLVAALKQQRATMAQVTDVLLDLVAACSQIAARAPGDGLERAALSMRGRAIQLYASEVRRAAVLRDLLEEAITQLEQAVEACATA